MAGRPLREIVDPGWADALEPVADRIEAMGYFLRSEVAAGRRYLPAGDLVLRAFQQPFADVRVLIVGQDPYPTPGHPVGLSFSVAPEVRRLPASLVNIFREYRDDLGYPAPATGDLSPWSERGIMLLNRVLTVQPGRPGSHRGKGWEEVTEQAIPALAGRGDLVGPRRPHPGPDDARCAERGIRPPEPKLGRPRLLRLAAVQPCQPPARGAGRRARRLEVAVTHTNLRIQADATASLQQLQTSHLVNSKARLFLWPSRATPLGGRTTCGAQAARPPLQG